MQKQHYFKSITSVLEEGKSVVLVLLDLTDALDTVDHDISDS